MKMNRYYYSVCNQLQKYCATSIRRKSSLPHELSSDHKFDFSLSKDVENDIIQNIYKESHHPGIMHVPLVKLPEILSKAIYAIKEEKNYQNKKLDKDAFHLAGHIFRRQPPYEEDELQQLVEMITSKLISKGKISPKFSEADQSIEDMTKEDKSKLTLSLKRHVYNWHPINYDEYKSFTYLWARLAPDYAALIRIFSEMKKRRPNFTPRFLFDFGSGVGSGMWAAESVWPCSIREVYNVDSNCFMNDLSERLFHIGVKNNLFESHKNSTYYRQFLPASEGIKYDIVLSSRSLFEVGNIDSRARTIDLLWKKVAPGGFLVIVEVGTMYGYTIMMEIRDYLHEMNKIEREKYNYNIPIHVFSPCPHDYPCPRFTHRSNSFCHFSVKYEPLSSCGVCLDKFSYIVLQKGERSLANEKLWPRIVEPVIKRHNHVITRSCTPAGNIQELVATKSKQSKTCYRVCKKCKWGDFLPVDIFNYGRSDQDNEASEFSDTDSGEITTSEKKMKS